MVDISVLMIDEKVRLDADRLAELYAQLGEAGAQDVVCRAMEELAVRLARVEGAYRTNNTSVLRKGAKGLVGIAEQVGMQLLADVARDVGNSVDENDPVALSATMTRLLRIGDRSLTAVWDLQDMSV